MEDRIEQTRNLYDSFVFGGDAGALGVAEQQLDAVRADLALARGRIVHGRFLENGEVDLRELALFEQALVLFQAIGDVRGEAESHFWIGIYHQVVEGNDVAAVPAFERAHALAKQIEDRRTMSYALRHLGVAEHAAGRLDTAREHLEASVELRKELGHLPGVAANLVGLAYIAAGQGRHDDARAIIDEARAIAEASEAHGTCGPSRKPTRPSGSKHAIRENGHRPYRRIRDGLVPRGRRCGDGPTDPDQLRAAGAQPGRRGRCQ